MMEKQADNYEREETEWNNLVSLYAGPRTAAVETAALTVRAMIPFTRVVESHGEVRVLRIELLRKERRFRRP